MAYDGVSKYGPARDGVMHDLGRIHAGLVRTLRRLDSWAAWSRSSKPCLDLLPEQIIRTPPDS